MAPATTVARMFCTRGQDVLQRATELRIKITPLSAYSPDFMPVEPLWHWMREEVTHSHCHSTPADLISAVAAFESEANRKREEVFFRLHVKTTLDDEQEKLRVC